MKHEHHKLQAMECIERLELANMFEIKDCFILSTHWKAFGRSSGTKSHWKYKLRAQYNIVIVDRILCKKMFSSLSGC